MSSLCILLIPPRFVFRLHIKQQHMYAWHIPNLTERVPVLDLKIVAPGGRRIIPFIRSLDIPDRRI